MTHSANSVETPEKIIDQLDRLLESERLALLNGELDKLSVFHAEKVTLIDALNKLDVRDQQRLRNLSAKVGRNQDLLNSAADGIRAVARRLAAVRRVRENLETYDEKGKRKAIDPTASRALEKRA